MGRTRQTQPGLTDRQREVLRLIAKGHTNSEIAERLGISLAGAKWHVSDLLTRFDVETRDELADHWTREARPARRITRFLATASGSLTLKPAAIAVGGVAALTVGVAAVAISLSDGDERGTLAAAASSPTVTRTPPPTPSPTPGAALPSAPGAIWSAADAYARAEAFARQRFDTDRNATVTYNALTLASARWKPAVSLFEGGDGDRYWVPPEGQATADLWVFEFESSGSVVNSADVTFDPARIFVQVVLEDGVADDEPTAAQHRYTRPNGEFIGGGAGSFRLRSADKHMEQRQREATPAGEVITFGWNNGVEGGAPLEAYVSAAGIWCVRGSNVDGSPGGGLVCQAQANVQPWPLQFSHGGSGRPGSMVMEDVFIFANVSASVIALGVLKDGAETRYPTYAPPAEAGFTRRFAWLGIGTVGTEGFEVVAYDAEGTELAREARGWMSPPPPPPPGRTP